MDTQLLERERETPRPAEAASAASRRAMRLVVLGGVLLATLELLRFAPLYFAVDDAWISFRIARNLVERGSATFDTTRPPVEGMTNLLWTLLSAAWVWAMPAVDPIFPARMIGALLHLATVVALALLAARVSREAGGRSEPAAGVAALLVACSGSMAFFAMSGLETALWGLLFVLSLERIDAALRGRRGAAPLAGVCLGLLAVCRPEGVLAGGVALGWLFAQPGYRRAALRAAAPFVAAVGSLEIFRWIAYGAWVPNTFFAKPPDSSSGLEYLGRFVLLGAGCFGLAAVWVAPRRVPITRLAASILLALGAGTVWSGGDWMPGYRRFTVEFLCLALIAAVAVALAAGRARKVAFLSAGCIAAANIAGAFLGSDHAGYNTIVAADLARMSAATPGVERVALADIGRFGWGFRGSIFDLGGLTDTHLARLPGKHLEKAWDETYFREARPDLVFVQSDRPIEDPSKIQFRTRPCESGVLNSMLARGGYSYAAHAQIGPALYLVMFRRDGLNLPPEVWGSVDTSPGVYRIAGDPER